MRFDVMRRPPIVNRRLAVILLAALAGCNYVPQMVTPYRMEIQQGNFITQEQVSQLKPGMTKDQVRFLLGTPLLTDPFHADRWDYVFSRTRENSRVVEQRRIAVFFDKSNVLEYVTGDVVPAGAAKPAAAAQPDAAAKPEAMAQQEEK